MNSTISLLRLVLPLMAGLLLSDAAWPQLAGDVGQWEVVRAWYGSSKRNVDVTGHVRDLARRNERFRVSNEQFGTDPHPGVEKRLRIEARDARGETRSFDYRENSYVDGRMFSGWGAQGGYRPPQQGGGQWQVLRATYGASGRNVNVTGRVRDLARGNERFTVNNEQFGVDPYPNVRKMLRVDARGPGGATRSFEYREGEIVDGRMFSGWVDEYWDQRGSRSGDESGW